MSGRMVAAAARRLALGLFFGVLGGLGAGALAAGSASAAGPLVPEPTSTGFSDGDIDEIGLSTWDLAYDPVGDRLVVADCEVVRALDVDAGTSTVIAMAEGLPNPTNVATFPGRVVEVAVRADGTVLLGLLSPESSSYPGCSALSFNEVARLPSTGGAVVIAGGGSTPLADGVVAADASFGATDLAISSGGRVFLANGGAPAFAFVEGGAAVEVMGGGFGSPPPADGGSALDMTVGALSRDIAVTPGGEVLFAYNGSLFRVDAAGTLHVVTASLPATAFAPALDVAGDGTIWAVGERAGAALAVTVDPTTGDVAEMASGADAGNLSYWAAVAVDASGRAYTTAPGRVLMVDGGSLAVVSGLAAPSGQINRWQGDGVPLTRQQLDPGFLNPAWYGLPTVRAGADGVVRIAGNRLVTYDPASGLTGTTSVSGGYYVMGWIGQRPDGNEVVVGLELDQFVYELQLLDPDTGVLTTLPVADVAGGFADVDAGGTIYVADSGGVLHVVSPAGVVTTEPLNVTRLSSLWATSSGLFAAVDADGLVRRVGTGWVPVADCATGAELFNPRVAQRDGRFLGTIEVFDENTGLVPVAWCRVDPAAGTYERLPGTPPANDQLPLNARESADGFVYYGMFDSAGRPAVARLAVAAEPATITLNLATIPAGVTETFTATGALSGTLSHGQTLTATVPAGTATVAVAGPAGWAATGVVCDDTDSAAGPNMGQVAFRTEPGEHVTCTIAITRAEADLSITKTVDQTTVVQGGTLVYTLRVTNQGPGVAVGVEMIDFLPSGVAFVSAGAGCGHDGAAVGGEVRCVVGDLEAGDSEARLIQVRAVTPGVISNSAGVISASADSDLTDNTTPAAVASIATVSPNPCQSGPGNELWAFGSNWSGELGISWPGSAVTPKPVNLVTQVADVATSSSAYTLVLRDDGLVCSFGYAGGGHLGRPFSVQPSPVQTDSGQPLADVGFVEIHRDAAYAIVDPDGDGAGVVWTWGRPPGAPSSGYQRARPITMPPGVEIVDVAGDDSSWTALDSNGQVYRWQSGVGPVVTPLGALEPGEHPTAVEADVLVTSHNRLFLYCTSLHAGCPMLGWQPKATAPAPIVVFDVSDDQRAGVLLVDDDGDRAGAVYAWGAWFGDGSIEPDPTLTRLVRSDLPEDVIDVSAGRHRAAVGVSGKVYGWGQGNNGALDNGGTHGVVLSPLEIGGFEHADLVSAGGGTFVRGDLADVPPLTETRNVYIQSPGMPGGYPLTDGTDSEGDGATAVDPLETTVSLLDGPFLKTPKEVWINESPVEAAIAPNLSGFQAWGQMVSLATTSNTSVVPFAVEFALYLTPSQRAAEQTFGGFIDAIAVLRNGAAVPACDVGPPSFSPDPCVVSRSLDPATGNAKLRILTSGFSTWMFQVPSPVPDAGGPYETVEGTPLTLAGQVTSDIPPEIRWVGAEGLLDDASALEAVFTASDDGSFPMRLTAGSADVFAADETTITVTNAAPVVGPLDAAPVAPAPGTPLTLSVPFTDAGRGDSHEVAISWGDGTPAEMVTSTVGGGATVTRPHTYAGAGTYTISVTVTDDDGGQATASRMVVVDTPAPVCTITGTSRADTLTGTAGPDVICGLGGADTINGLGGDDVLIGGPGGDTLNGGNGNDRLAGGDGVDTLNGGNNDDRLEGGDGADWLSGSGGSDTLIGGDGADRIEGEGGDDVLRGGSGDDTLTGGSGRDRIDGDDGADRLNGSEGDDTLTGGSGPDILDGGSGTDACDLGPGGTRKTSCES